MIDREGDYTPICGDPLCQWCRPSPEEIERLAPSGDGLSQTALADAGDQATPNIIGPNNAAS